MWTKRKKAVQVKRTIKLEEVLAKEGRVKRFKQIQAMQKKKRDIPKQRKEFYIQVGGKARRHTDNQMTRKQTNFGENMRTKKITEKSNG